MGALPRQRNLKGVRSMASIAQINANRENAKRSTGPKSQCGKSTVSANALRTGLRSGRLLVEGENSHEFATLCSDLNATLRPVGAVEFELAERIAVALWRQRRLVMAEAAAINLEQRPAEIAKAANRLCEPGLTPNISPDNLGPFDDDRAAWCRSILREAEALGEIRPDTLEVKAPLIHAQLMRDAEEEGEHPDRHLESFEHGVTSYVGELVQWCQSELKAAEMRPRLLELVEQLKIKRLVLPLEQLEVLARYQTTLDNQLYKALRAFREAQEWRMKTMDSVANEPPHDVFEAP